jgi:hypothetical protein
MIKLEDIFKVRIVYKSGYTHDFEVKSFEITHRAMGPLYEWEPIDEQNKPLHIEVGEIAAIYQVGMRRRLVWR